MVPPHFETLSTAPAKAPLLPQAGNFAFALRMLGLDSPAFSRPIATAMATQASTEAPIGMKTAPASTQPAAPQNTVQNTVPAAQPRDLSPQSSSPAPEQSSSSAGNPAPSAPRQDAQPSTPDNSKSNAASPNRPDSPVNDQPKVDAAPHWSAAPVFDAPETNAAAPLHENAEPPQPNVPLAAQETHLLVPEVPKSPASSEILLHLTGLDQSSAAIRVADRAGSVNVSVHASDPTLRDALRTNISELSTQLNEQGWRADVIKPAVTPVHFEGQRDTPSGGQRGSQHQSPGGERPPQRDRRSSSGQWQQEFDQQISGGSAPLGGNR